MKQYQIFEIKPSGSEVQVKGLPKNLKAIRAITYANAFKKSGNGNDFIVKEIEVIYTTKK